MKKSTGAWCWIFAAAAAICAVSLAFRLYNLTAHTLWYDEIITVIRVKLLNEDPGRYFPHISKKITAGYLLPLSVIFRYCGSDFCYRLTHALFGVASVLLMIPVGNRLFGRGIGWIAAVILMFSAFHIRYSQEVRWYSYVLMLELALVLIYTVARGSPRLRHWALFVLAGLFLLFCGVPYSVIVVAAVFAGLFIEIILRRKRNWFSVAYLVASGLICGLALVFFLKYAGYLNFDFTESGREGLAKHAFYGNVFKTKVNDDFILQVLSHYIGTNIMGGMVVNRAMYFALFFSLVGVVAGFARRPASAFICLSIVVASLLVHRINVYFNFWIQVRYAIFGLPFFVLLTAVGIERAASFAAGVLRGGAALRVAGVAVVLGVLLFSQRTVFYEYYVRTGDVKKKMDWRYIGKFIDSNAGEDEWIVVGKRWPHVAGPGRLVKFYAPGREVFGPEALGKAAGAGKGIWFLDSRDLHKKLLLPYLKKDRFRVFRFRYEVTLYYIPARSVDWKEFYNRLVVYPEMLCVTSVANGLVALGEEGRAMEIARDNVRRLPYLADRAWIHFWLGRQLRNTKRYPESIKELKISAEYDPGNCDTWTMLASSLLASGDFEEAVSAADRAIGVAPAKMHYPYTIKANALERLGRFEEAVAVYKKEYGIFDDPRFRASISARIKAVERKGRFGAGRSK